MSRGPGVVLNFTASEVEGEWSDENGYTDYIVIKCEGYEIYRAEKVWQRYDESGVEAVVEAFCEAFKKLLDQPSDAGPRPEG